MTETKHDSAVIGLAADAIKLVEFGRSNTLVFDVTAIPHPDQPGRVIPLAAVYGNGKTEIQGLRNIIDPWRTHPERRKGLTTLHDLSSFIAFVQRSLNTESVLFANAVNKDAPVLLAVFDHDDRVNDLLGVLPEADGAVEAKPVQITTTPREEALPRFGEHQAIYRFPLSDEWKAWTGNNGPSEAMDQAEFAAFIEERIVDVIHPPSFEDVERLAAEARAAGRNVSAMEFARLQGGIFASPQKLMELSRGIEVHQEEAAKTIIDPSSGEVQLAFSSANKDATGAPLSVPKLFLIQLPIFENGTYYQLVVRLRYRVREGKVKWWYELYRPEASFRHAFEESAVRAGTETELPVYYGSPALAAR